MLLAAGCAAAPVKREPLLLFSSLPLYWGEAGDPAAMLAPNRETHWVRAALEERWRLDPIDTLEPDVLRGQARLLMAQPRPLSPQENVALDAWVGAGGRLLLFADPALTAPSAFPLGDRRRPQDVALLSPILARWGLRLTFDENQTAGRREITDRSGLVLPVDLPGRLEPARGGRGDARCHLDAEQAVARCRIGRGRVFIVADAAVLDPVGPADRQRAALDRLTEEALGPLGETAG